MTFNSILTPLFGQELRAFATISPHSDQLKFAQARTSVLSFGPIQCKLTQVLVRSVYFSINAAH